MEDEGWTRVQYRRGRMVPVFRQRQQNTVSDTVQDRSSQIGRGYSRTWGPAFRRFPNRPTTIYEPRYERPIRYQDEERSPTRGRDNYRISYAEMTKRPPRPGGRRNYSNERVQYRPRVFYRQQQPRKRINPNYYRTQPVTRRQNNNYIPPSPQLKEEIKMIFKLIRLTHHLQNITPTEKGGLPATFSRLETYLSTVIRPAFPTDGTRDNLIGNSKNWIHTTQLILEDHYETLIRETVEEFIPNITDDWRLALEIAGRWAHRSFGKRLQQDTIASVEALILASLDETTTTDVEQIRVEPTTPNQPRNTQYQSPSREPEVRNITTATLQDLTSSLPCIQPKPQRFRHSAPCVQNVIMEIIPDPVEENLPSTVTRRSPDPVEEENLPSAATQRSPDPVEEENLPFTVIRHPPEPTPPSRNRLTALISTASQKQLTFGRQPPQVTVPPPVTSSPGEAEEQQNLIELEELVQEEDILSSPVHHDTSRVLTPTPQLTNPDTPLTRPTRHMNTPRKLVDWSLMVRKKWLIMGDSNVATFPAYSNLDLQIDSFPGANFVHAESLLKKAVTHTNVEKLVLSFGINHRTQKLKQTAIKQLQRAVHAAKVRFPYAEIWIPEINFPKSLPLAERSLLEKLNTHIRNNIGHIPSLPSEKFTVRSDGIHWTAETAKAMLQHWTSHLNF